MTGPIRFRNCPTCHGTGDCQKCNGYDIDALPLDETDEDALGPAAGGQCAECRGSYKCVDCGGRGELEVTS